ncbi:MAG: AMP-binding protein [Mesorhizobium sp.]
MGIDFVDGLARFGDAPALLTRSGETISYRELSRRVDAFALSLGPKKRLLALEAAHSEHMVVAYLGALRGGHAVALVSAEDGAEGVRRFQPELFYRSVDGRWRLDAAEEEPGAASLHPDLALLLKTSGSTGIGKGVRLSRQAVASNASAIAAYLGLVGSDRAALILPLHYCYGLSVLNAHLAVGASVWLSDRSIVSAGFLPGLKESGATNLSGVPYSFELLDRIGFRTESFPALRLMTVAGGRLAAEMLRSYARHMERQGGHFFAMYGQTEATARMAYLPPDMALAHPDCIGVAIPGGELAIVDEQGRSVDAWGQTGELVFRGPNVMMGYAETRDDLARGAELSELATGDLAERDPRGLFRVVGRKSRMSKIAGIRLGHDALEAGLAAQGIGAAVVGDDERVVAVFASAHSARHVRDALAQVAGLTRTQADAVRVAALPRLASGKVDLKALACHLTPEPPSEAADVRQAFAEAFYPYPVEDGDSFARLGGDSLRYVQLYAALERRLGRLPEDWERLTIADLAARQPKSRKEQRSVGLDILIRALAITLVVIHHATLWPIPGGSAVMMVMIGYGLARFQKEALLERDMGRFFRPLVPVLAPYFLIVGLYSLAWGEVPWASILLAGNLGFADPANHSMLPYLYWFIEAYAQTLLVFAALFLLAPLRRLAMRDAFMAGCVMLGGALLLRFAQPVLWPIGPRAIFSLPWVLHLAMLGWCVASADTLGKRLTIVAVAAMAVPLLAYGGGNWTGSWVRYGLVFAAVAGLAFLPRRIPLPNGLAGAALAIAAAGYHIYLFHRFVPETILAPIAPTVPGPAFALLAILGGLLCGLVAFRFQQIVVRRGSRRSFSGAAASHRRMPAVAS